MSKLNGFLLALVCLLVGLFAGLRVPDPHARMLRCKCGGGCCAADGGGR